MAYHFAEGIFLTENFIIWIQIWLVSVAKGEIDNMSTMAQAITWIVDDLVTRQMISLDHNEFKKTNII